jgi:hypothetical protein
MRCDLTSSLGNLTPDEFIRETINMEQAQNTADTNSRLVSQNGVSSRMPAQTRIASFALICGVFSSKIILSGWLIMIVWQAKHAHLFQRLP